MHEYILNDLVDCYGYDAVHDALRLIDVQWSKDHKHFTADEDVENIINGIIWDN